VTVRIWKAERRHKQVFVTVVIETATTHLASYMRFRKAESGQKY
jgi:hypothetical protein